MKASIVAKLEILVERYEEVQALLGDPDTINDQKKYRELTKEYSQLEEVVLCFKAFQSAQEDQAAAELMLEDDDEDMRSMAEDEVVEAKAAVEKLADDLQILLLPKDPNDDRNCLLKFAPVLVVMKRLFLRVIYSVCTVNTVTAKNGE